MVHWADKLNIDVVPSAVTAARRKINPAAFEQIFDQFNRKTKRTVLFKGKLILAVDGSQQSLYGSHDLRNSSEDKEDPYLGKTKNGFERRFIHINAIYDCLEQTYIDFVLQAGSEMNEDKALDELCRRLNVGLNEVIVCADRGYQNQMTFYRLTQLGQYFVIRIIDKDSRGNILKDFELPNTETYDEQRSILLSCNNQVAALRRNGETRPIKYISNHEEYEEFGQDEKLPLDLRIVCLKLITYQDKDNPSDKSRCGVLVITPKMAQEYLDTGITPLKKLEADGFKPVKTSFVTLATNLNQEEFTTEDIAYIYKKRWKIETSFNHLKHDLGVGKLHSRRPELIEQEIYAQAAAYNVSSRIRNELEEIKAARKAKKKERKSARQRNINFGFVIEQELYHIFPTDNQLCRELKETALRHTHQVDPDLPDTRPQK